MTTFLGIPLTMFLELLASAVVAFGTIFSGLFARQSVVEARKLRQMQDEPGIAVTLWQQGPVSPFLNLWIENFGTGAAYDLRLTIDREIEPLNNRNLLDLGIFAHGIPCFPPGHQMVFLFGDRTRMLQTSCRTVTISATYRTFDQALHVEAFLIDIESLAGMIQRSPFDDIANGLSTIGRKLGGF